MVYGKGARNPKDREILGMRNRSVLACRSSLIDAQVLNGKFVWFLRRGNKESKLQKFECAETLQNHLDNFLTILMLLVFFTYKVNNTSFSNSSICLG